MTLTIPAVTVSVTLADGSYDREEEVVEALREAVEEAVNALDLPGVRSVLVV